jgi:hypothetical protein
MMERAVLLSKAARIEPSDLSIDSQGSFAERAPANVGWDVPSNMPLEEMEKILIESTLKRTGGNRRRRICWGSSDRGSITKSEDTTSTPARSVPHNATSLVRGCVYAL